jgi:hypothetical protein
MEDIRYVHKVTVGSINPNAPLTDEKHNAQVDLLNRCLGEFPKGKIIGKDVAFGSYKLGEHQITMQQVTYHIGFQKRPHWLSNKPD